jgi:hypothetical protein
MGDILGLGVTHSPPMLGVAENMNWVFRQTLADPALPEQFRDPAGWPEPLRREWGTDDGLAAAIAHRAEVGAGFRRARKALDEFEPDVVLIWGDDQYENFQEDIVPAFCVQAYGDAEVRPWQRSRFATNAWGEERDKAFVVRGHPEAGRYLATRLLEREFDIAYAYRPLHHPDLAHAFLNTVLLLDIDRAGFPYPCVPIAVNCYGRSLISNRGFRGRLDAPAEQPDPPSPSPRRCMALGAAIARICSESPWRVALIASSSWSHSFLTRKHAYLYPDVAADRRLYEALRRGDYETWRRTPLAALEDAGQHEVLNWYCLAGAMEALGRKPDECDYAETWAFVAGKCIAVWRPYGG